LTAHSIGVIVFWHDFSNPLTIFPKIVMVVARVPPLYGSLLRSQSSARGYFPGGIMGKKITLTEIAKSAGVSVATVSRVLRGTARVSPELETHVRTTALKLGFNLSEQTCNRTACYLVCNRRTLHGFYSRILLGAEEYFAAHAYNLMFASLKYDTRVELQDVHLPAILQHKNVVCGYIVVGRIAPNLLECLRRRGIPLAVLGNHVIGEWQDKEHDVVWFDELQGTYELTRFLQSLGHRDMCFIGHSGLPWSARRYQGYAQAMTEAGLDPQLIEEDSDDYFDVGYMAAKSALSRSRGFTAILAASDSIAQGVYWALSDCHLEVPKDISVTGFDDIDAAFLHPPLTTVSAFPEQIGKRLAETLLNRIAHPDLAPQQCMIPTRVVRRGSHRLRPTELLEGKRGQVQMAHLAKTDDGSRDPNTEPPTPEASQITARLEIDLPQVAQHRK
jgi:DNA-binding LacI/PurR family transcriptional regulator